MNERGTLKVFTQERGAELGDLFGIFFEDLNHAADGGLYAELVQNRSFEFDPIDHSDYHALTAWGKVERGKGSAELTVEESAPFSERNKHYAVIEILSEGDGVGILNQGFNSGIPVKEGEAYMFSFYARRDSSFDVPVRIAVEGLDGIVHAAAEIAVCSDEWTKYEAVMTAKATDYSSRLVIVTKGSGKLYLDMVSLFPAKTFRDRPNGMREDIAAMIAELKPKFMRFPGGCLVHDGSLNADERNSMYRWKNTIGDIEQRPARRNNWRYNQTLGLGYYEYFLFCEDIGAKPIPILTAGYDPHHKRIVPLDELQPWIDDALDLIEFACGDSSTEWGGIRAGLGHPEPFGLEYIGIGNEEVGEPFFERYAYFHRAIKEKYPAIKIINSSGPFAAGGEYERGWNSARENRSDLVDEHYYQSPEWFLANYNRYDHFKVDEPKVFLGEYASWGNTYYNALVEAAFMTGLEKNAHAVGLACYAPMLCNVDYVNWKPDMIWFNNHEVYGTVNYYVQQLFMHHQGDHLLKIEARGFERPHAEPAASITGKLTLCTDLCSIQFRDVRLINDETGEIKCFEGLPEVLSDMQEDRLNGTAKRSMELGETDWDSYTLRFKAKKISGPKGFDVCFGKSDDKNQLIWEVGGWQNQDSMVVSKVDGRGSCLTQSLFTVETGIEYDFALEVSGRRIRTYVDGVLINDTEDKLPVIEAVYYSASSDRSTGDVIVKVVNVQEQSAAGQVVLEDLPKTPSMVEVIELSGYGLDEENDFESPKRIVPKRKELHPEANSFFYDFPGHSVTIFRVKKVLKQDRGRRNH
ncbi:carbohydrate binding domain-containing protein [Paenibacillus alkaliterrae]|uniref:alpha-L-arabinofuranosidase C-terminal domain-containing protein n=1 Tax=Paenibacillus alkaliterrae TaxID=320909 RepID=UPI001F2759AC|nr:alpha-L-arabinofuranosidase C-terminal domain-containing protein [Paenibacillus alkaliterrae]MCF2939719.1 carbohydrate binding domain-containing protein [Paenibacillus alkaliterrae]